MNSSYKPEDLAAASTKSGDNKVGTIVSTGERMVIKIPFSEIEKVSIYLNTAKKRAFLPSSWRPARIAS